MLECLNGCVPQSYSIRRRIEQVDEQISDGDSKERRQLKQSRLHRKGRGSAEGLLLDLGVREVFVGVTGDCSPQWPRGYVGSITHTSRWVGVAVAPAHLVRSIGVDIETILKPYVVAEIALARVGSVEALLGEKADLPSEPFVSICFSAKEALFKSPYPIMRKQFRFHDVDLMGMDAAMERGSVLLFLDLTAESRVGYRIEDRYRTRASRSLVRRFAN